MIKNIAIIGCGGHAKVLVDIINLLDNYNIIGFYDDKTKDNFYKYPILGNINDLNNGDKSYYYIIGIGDNLIRKQIFDKFNYLNWDILIHPSSIISKYAKINKGSVICAGAIIQTEVIIGENSIINTNCNIDHESIIGNHVSISPGSVICGKVIIHDLCFIGANCTIIQNITIGKCSIIGAGSVIIRNIKENLKIVGNPGMII